MRRMIHNVKGLVVAALALIGSWKVADWMCEGTTWLLVNRGFWEPQAAADAAPWILFALGSGLAMSLYGMYQECQRYKNSSPYGRVPHSESRSDDNRRAG